MAENEKVFRDSFRGYNKNDVNTYISSLTESTKKAVEDADARAARAEREEENCKSELEISERKADELAIELYSAEKTIGEKEKALSEAEEKISSLENEIALLKSELEEKNIALENALEKLSCAEKDKEDERSRIYAELDGRIDELMKTASDNAHGIIERAIDKSGKIIAEAESRASEIKSAAADEARQMGKNISDDYYDEFRRFASDTRQSVDSLIKNIENKGLEIQNRMSSSDGTEKDIIFEVSGPTPKKTPKKSFDERIDDFFKTTIASLSNRRDSGKKE